MSTKLSLWPRPSKEQLDKFNSLIPGMDKEEGWIMDVEVPAMAEQQLRGIQQRTGHSAKERM